MARNKKAYPPGLLLGEYSNKIPGKHCSLIGDIRLANRIFRLRSSVMKLDRYALKVACELYVETIYQLSEGEIDALIGDAVRREYHQQILELTGLSEFEFGGIPAWMQIDDVHIIAKRLYNALIRQIEVKQGN